MKFMIVVIMFFADPYYKGHDAITVHTYNNKPLEFNSMNMCEQWILNDLDNLKSYAKTVYPEAVAVKEIMCIDKGLGEGEET